MSGSRPASGVIGVFRGSVGDPCFVRAAFLRVGDGPHVTATVQTPCTTRGLSDLAVPGSQGVGGSNPLSSTREIDIEALAPVGASVCSSPIEPACASSEPWRVEPLTLKGVLRFGVQLFAV